MQGQAAPHILSMQPSGAAMLRKIQAESQITTNQPRIPTCGHEGNKQNMAICDQSMQPDNEPLQASGR